MPQVLTSNHITRKVAPICVNVSMLAVSTPQGRQRKSQVAKVKNSLMELGEDVRVLHLLLYTPSVYSMIA